MLLCVELVWVKRPDVETPTKLLVPMTTMPMSAMTAIAVPPMIIAGPNIHGWSNVDRRWRHNRGITITIVRVGGIDGTSA
jgi:ribosomal protein L13E